MPARFARADLVVCRSGASTVAEIAAAGKPAIFVPFPRAADDHQRRNAEALRRKRGAAVVVEESKLEAAGWPTRSRTLLQRSRAPARRWAAAAQRFAHPECRQRNRRAWPHSVAGMEED